MRLSDPISSVALEVNKCIFIAISMMPSQRKKGTAWSAAARFIILAFGLFLGAGSVVGVVEFSGMLIGSQCYHNGHLSSIWVFARENTQWNRDKQ